jgi:DNA-binding MarR family transcriptional regulator/GNAT superfamily N-acetyltransferase
MQSPTRFEAIRDIRRFNRDFTVRLGLLSRYRFDTKLTLAAARVLLEIGSGGPRSHSGLQRLLGIDAGYLSRIIAKLESDGLVVPQANPQDARGKLLSITSAGKAELDRVNDESDRQMAGLLDHLDDAALAELRGYLAGFERLAGRIGPDGLTVKPVSAPALMPTVAGLFAEYAAGLGVDLGFQDFQAELASLPGKYAAPAGSLLCAFDRDQALGCVALRPMEEAGCCEMKRLYVIPAARGRKLGERLALAIIEEARRLGYARMRLDTLAKLEAACGLYRALGFREIPAYYDNPLPGVVYFELDLAVGPTVPAGSPAT